MEEELQEADVLWPETPSPLPSSSQDHGLYRYQYLPPPPSTPEQYELATSSFSCESFGEPPASSSSSSSALSGSFLSYVPSTSFAGDEDDAVAEEFQEADVLWPDDDFDATGQRWVDDDVGGELWWRLRYVFGDGAAGRHGQEPAAAGNREACRRLASSPIDIPTNTTRAAAAAAARRRPTSALHRR